ncbi:MAG: hypothetical protein M1833_005117 [Piccolia ochrophora]|nr:MAG: hypothetical protein M1833_005117 [Piccolia ochrophora]
MAAKETTRVNAWLFFVPWSILILLQLVVAGVNAFSAAILHSRSAQDARRFAIAVSVIAGISFVTLFAEVIVYSRKRLRPFIYLSLNGVVAVLWIALLGMWIERVQRPTEGYASPISQYRTLSRPTDVPILFAVSIAITLTLTLGNVVYAIIMYRREGRRTSNQEVKEGNLEDEKGSLEVEQGDPEVELGNHFRSLSSELDGTNKASPTELHTQPSLVIELEARVKPTELVA